MEPREVRLRVLGDHDQLRKDLARVEGFAREMLDGIERPIAALRAEAEEIVNRLFVHMRWEECHLLPALRDADAWGAERAELLVRDHHAQRDMLEFALARLRDVVRPPTNLAQDILYLVDRLRTDMQVEEQDILDERVLRDDVVGIDVHTG